MIKLGELEFKAEDFGEWSYAENCAKLANRLLAERLEKAPFVIRCENFMNTGAKAWVPGAKLHFGDNIIARLVCIQDVTAKLVTVNGVEK